MKENCTVFNHCRTNGLKLIKTLVSLFPGYDWVLLHECYLREKYTPHNVLSTRQFFTQLGVVDFLSVQETIEVMTLEQLVSTGLLMMKTFCRLKY